MAEPMDDKTFRDTAAAAVFAALIASDRDPHPFTQTKDFLTDRWLSKEEWFAVRALRYADTLLTERNRGA